MKQTKSIEGLKLQSQATRFLSRFQDEGTWHDREAMELQKAIDQFFETLVICRIPDTSQPPHRDAIVRLTIPMGCGTMVCRIETTQTECL